jgi:hypothetical protein
VRVERGLEGKGDFDDLKGGGAAQLRKKTKNSNRAINSVLEDEWSIKKEDPRIRSCHHTTNNHTNTTHQTKTSLPE